jgi:hypothetical protein
VRSNLGGRRGPASGTSGSFDDDDGNDASGHRSGERELREEREKRERKKKGGAGLKFPPITATGLVRLLNTRRKVAGPSITPQQAV